MGTGASPLTVGSVGQLSVSLIAVVGLIFALAWLLRRLRIAGPPSRGEITVIDQLSLGPRERIALIRVGEAQVLVGIGAGSVVALQPLADPIKLKSDPPPPPFADRLRDFMKGRASP